MANDSVARNRQTMDLWGKWAHPCFGWVEAAPTGSRGVLNGSGSLEAKIDTKRIADASLLCFAEKRQR
jgi:hypothetical protein